MNFAQVRQRGRFVFVLLRGGFDGLAAVVPYGDPAYDSLRGTFAFDESDLITLNDTFGLAPGLAPLRESLAARRARRHPRDGDSLSHAQSLRRPGDSRNRHRSAGRIIGRLVESDAAGDDRRSLRHRDRVGDAAIVDRARSMCRPGRRPSLAPWTTSISGGWRCCIERISALHGRFEAALQQQNLVGEEPMAGGNARRGGITPLMQAAARILKQDGGPNIAAVEFSGWDTHANQGLAGGALDRLLGQLAEGLVAFRTEMEGAWANTTVVVMTEFGRTARPNGTRGTDHGTAGAGFVIGPQVAEVGRVLRLARPGRSRAVRGTRSQTNARHARRV